MCGGAARWQCVVSASAVRWQCVVSASAARWQCVVSAGAARWQCVADCRSPQWPQAETPELSQQRLTRLCLEVHRSHVWRVA